MANPTRRAPRRAGRASLAPSSAGARIISLLQCIAEGDGETQLKDLSARLDLPASTAHRLLQLMVKADLVERTSAQGYRPGREFLRIAALVLRKFDYIKLARPMLQDLWSEWGETSAFCLYKPASKTALVADTIRTAHPLQFVLEPMAEIPLAWGSLGRSILAFLPGEEVDAVLAMSSQGPLSGRPPPSRIEMREQLKLIRRLGYALYEDRTMLNLAGVAAPVFGADGAVLGSLGVTMPASRFTPADRAGLCKAVVVRAHELSTALGASN